MVRLLLPLGVPIEVLLSGRSYMNNFAAATEEAQTTAVAVQPPSPQSSPVGALIRKSADALLASHKNAEGHPRPCLPFLPGSPVVIENSAHDGI